MNIAKIMLCEKKAKELQDCLLKSIELKNHQVSKVQNILMH